MPTTALAHAGRALVAALGVAVVGGFMLAVYRAVPDPDAVDRLQWGLLAVWTLALPAFWGQRLGRRLGRLSALPGGAELLAAALGGLWLELMALGLGAAVVALVVIRACL